MLYIFRHIKIFSLVSFCLIIDCRLIQCYLRNCFHIVLIYFLLRSSFPNGEGNGTPLQHSCLENPMDGGAWWATVHGVAKSWTRLSNFTFTFHFHALEKEMATHSSVLAWRILEIGEPGGLPSMGSHRVRHDWSDLAVAAAADLEWRLIRVPWWDAWILFLGLNMKAREER